MDPRDKERRKVLLRQVRGSNRAQVRNSLPVAADLMAGLFDYVDDELQHADCDHSLKHTLEYIRDKKLPKQLVIEWLESAGGFCDCEVIANAEEQFQEALRQ